MFAHISRSFSAGFIGIPGLARRRTVGRVRSVAVHRQMAARLSFYVDRHNISDPLAPPPHRPYCLVIYLFIAEPNLLYRVSRVGTMFFVRVRDTTDRRLVINNNHKNRNTVCLLLLIFYFANVY